MPEETLNVVETEVTEQVDTQTEVETPQEKTYTESELQKIIKDRISREKKAAEKAVEEAKKLAKMNEDEKAKYEMDKLKEELADLKRKDAQYGLSKEASKMLAEKGVSITEKLLGRMIGETAEETSEYINDYAESVLFGIAEGVKKALSGTAPKMNVAGNQAMTKEQFNKLSYPDRMELFKTNPTLYNQLK